MLLTQIDNSYNYNYEHLLTVYHKCSLVIELAWSVSFVSSVFFSDVKSANIGPSQHRIADASYSHRAGAVVIPDFLQ